MIPDRLRWKLIAWLWPNKRSSVGSCANRTWRTTRMGHIEVTVTFRDTSQQDGYSREELLEMLRTVRKHEAVQGWRVPECKPS